MRNPYILAICLILFKGLFLLPLFSLATDLKIYQTDPFDFVNPDSKIVQPPVDTISMRMAENEYQSCALSLVSDIDLPNLTVEIDDLKNSTHKIAAKDIDLRVVKIWKQAGILWTLDRNSHEVSVPELLLKDDTVPFVDSWKGNFYVSPALPGVFKTNLIKSQAKQIIITVATEPGVSSGIFVGKLRFFSNGKLTKNITLHVEVLPIFLPESPKRNVMYFEGPLAPTGPNYLSNLEYDHELSDIRAHGFNGITIYDIQYPDICAAVDIAALAGFKTVVITFFSPHTSDTVAKLCLYCQEKNIEVYFYGVDEPTNTTKLKAHIEKSVLIHKGKGKIVTAITKDKDLELDSHTSSIYGSFSQGTYEPLDWTNYHLGASQSYIDDLIRDKTKRSSKSKIETYYWQIMQENPAMHRLYSGFYFWTTKLDGIFPYCYQQLFEGFSPYNGDDKHFVSGKWMMRALNVVYPSQDGPVPTLQWAAIREGINDQRYLARLTALSEEKKVDVSKEINGILSPFHYIGFYSNGFQLLSGKDFKEARNKIISLILRLQSE